MRVVTNAMPLQKTAIGVKTPISASVSVMPRRAAKERPQSTAPLQTLAIKTRIAALVMLTAAIGAQICLEALPLARLNAIPVSR
jgi:hypothetical protein